MVLSAARAASHILVAILILLAVAPSAFGSDVEEGSDWAIERRQARHEVDAGRAIVVVNRHGDVRLRRTEEAIVDLSMVEQRRQDAATRLEVVVDETDGAIRVTVVERREGSEPDATAPAEEWDRAAERSGRLDLVVFVPPESAVRVQTDGGFIEGKRLRHDVDAVSRVGDIRISTTGTVNARSERGSVSVAFGALPWSPPVVPKLATTTGDLRVILPADADLAIDAVTNGRITTDYSIEIDREPGLPLKRARCRIGQATRRLDLESDRGRIEIFREPGS